MNEVQLSKGPKPESQRRKEDCCGLARVGHVQLEAENRNELRDLIKHGAKFPKDQASVLAQRKKERKKLKF